MKLYIPNLYIALLMGMTLASKIVQASGGKQHFKGLGIAIAARQVAGKLKKKVAHRKQPERIGIADLLDSLESSEKEVAEEMLQTRAMLPQRRPYAPKSYEGMPEFLRVIHLQLDAQWEGCRAGRINTPADAWQDVPQTMSELPRAFRVRMAAQRRPMSVRPQFTTCPEDAVRAMSYEPASTRVGDQLDIVTASELGPSASEILKSHGIPYGWFADRNRYNSASWTRHRVLLFSGTPVGYCQQCIIHHSQLGDITYLGVSEPHRGKKYGSMLLEDALQYMPRAKVHKVYIEYVERAMPLYTRYGFTEDPDKIHMSLVLTPRLESSAGHPE